MTATQYPNRVRLHGGRNTHAFGPTPGLPDGITACGYPIGTSEERKPDDAVITCRNCIREMNR